MDTYPAIDHWSADYLVKRILDGCGISRMNWADGLPEFLTRFDQYAFRYLDARDAHGCPDLPDYERCMGPRFTVRGYGIPISVFRGEGVILWALAHRVLRTEVIVETFTGTGVAACFLAAARPDIPVYTVDHYGEGNLGDAGWDNMQSLRRDLGLSNLIALRGSWDDLTVALRSQAVGLYFCDGVHQPILPARCTVIHDETSMPPRGFRVPGSSLMVVTAIDDATLAEAEVVVDTARTWLHNAT